MPAIGVGNVGTKGGDFDFVDIAGDEHNTEPGAHAQAFGEDAHDLIRSGVGGDIVIGGLATQQNIAHTTTYEQRLIAIALEYFANRIGKFSWSHGMIMHLRLNARDIYRIRGMREGYLQRRTSNVMSSDWRVAPTN